MDTFAESSSAAAGCSVIQLPSSSLKDTGEIEEEDYIPQEELQLIRTKDGYMTTLGKNADAEKLTLKDTDKIVQNENILTTDTVLFFSDQGKCYGMKAHQLPHGAGGLANAARIFSMKSDEKIICAAVLKPKNFVVFATTQGLIKKTKIEEYDSIRSNGIAAIKIKKDDAIISVHVIGNEDYLMATQEGMVIRFKTTGIRPMGRNAAGVCGMKLKDDDRVLNAFSISDTDSIAFAFENSMKKKKGKDYKVQNRGGKGVHGVKILKRDGKLCQVGKIILTN